MQEGLCDNLDFLWLERRESQSSIYQLLIRTSIVSNKDIWQMSSGMRAYYKERPAPMINPN